MATSISIIIPDTWECLQLSNQTLLEISIALFALFAIAEFIGAIASDALTLLGDSISMSVDVVTYICNAYVEWYKANHIGHSNNRSMICVEIVIPILSLFALLGTTIYIVIDAINLLHHPPAKDDVNVDYLFSYSVGNFVVDIICSGLFYLRRNQIFQEQETIPKISLNTSISFNPEDDLEVDEEEKEFGTLDGSSSRPTTSSTHLDRHEDCFSTCKSCFTCGCCTPSSSGHVNINMMSAFVHVLGDTLRTIAIFLAAFVSTITGIDGDICDAWAAILVSGSILVICWPLMVAIVEKMLAVYGYEMEDCCPSWCSWCSCSCCGGGHGHHSSADSHERGKYRQVSQIGDEGGMSGGEQGHDHSHHHGHSHGHGGDCTDHSHHHHTHDHHDHGGHSHDHSHSTSSTNASSTASFPSKPIARRSISDEEGIEFVENILLDHQT
jgi:Co/Zn/Cd efflux system component